MGIGPQKKNQTINRRLVLFLPLLVLFVSIIYCTNYFVVKDSSVGMVITQVSPAPRSDFAMAYDNDSNRIIIYGGLACAFSKESCYFIDVQILNDIWALDLETNTWEELKPSTSPPPLWGHRMVYDSVNKKVILFGGGKTYDWKTMSSQNRSSETWEYDSVTNSWSNLSISSTPTPRYYHGMVYDTNLQKIYLFGGRQIVTAISDTWMFDYQNMTWTELTPNITPLDKSDPYYMHDFARSAYAMAYDSHNQKIIFHGGSNAGAGITNSTWVYDALNNSWEEKTPPESPGRRYHHSMVYDKTLSKCILFGGGTAPPEGGYVENLGDTWAYNYTSNSWEDVPVTNSPTPRYSHEMVYSSLNDQVVMFGGFSNYPDDVVNPPYNKRFNDVWGFKYSEMQWTSLVASGTTQTTPTTEAPTTTEIPTTTTEAPTSTTEVPTITEPLTTTTSKTTIIGGTPTIDHPNDITITIGTSGNKIMWNAQCSTPSRYTVTRDGEILFDKPWDGSPIVVNVDHLSKGSYVYEITVSSTNGESVSDTVVVFVEEESTVPGLGTFGFELPLAILTLTVIPIFLKRVPKH
ncbi:MAG: hypothetical protein JSV04_08410 [Candidatus Heimdallarchaeota archaeon]|nr:MAG: hypothetical protein JSV04_08410 [Candidatus Heimdallarchaeota archaeon]